MARAAVGERRTERNPILQSSYAAVIIFLRDSPLRPGGSAEVVSGSRRKAVGILLRQPAPSRTQRGLYCSDCDGNQGRSARFAVLIRKFPRRGDARAFD
jgi:hypothetical protein